MQSTPPLDDQAPFSIKPQWHPALWTMPAIVFGLSIIGLFGLPDAWPLLPMLLAMLLAVFVTPVVAVLVDGRADVPVLLGGSMPAVVTMSLVLASMTERWRTDDGLGTGLVAFVLAAVVAVYIVAGQRGQRRRRRFPRRS